MNRARHLSLLSAACATAAAALGCSHGRSLPGRSSAASLPAGFVEHLGKGWRVAVPSTWPVSAKAPAGVWQAVDPQAADHYHANVSVIVEPFPGDSHSYAAAGEALLRKQPEARVENSLQASIDGDPTLLIEALWSPHPTSKVTFRTVQAPLASRGRGYVVTCAVGSEAFARYRSTCDTVVRSFAVER